MNRFAGTVENGKVATPFGDVAAQNVADGTDVEVLVRPEGLQIEEALNGHNVLAHVDAVRVLGEVNLVHLTLEAGDHIHARVPRRLSPINQPSVAITLDPDMTFVFPIT